MVYDHPAQFGCYQVGTRRRTDHEIPRVAICADNPRRAFLSGQSLIELVNPDVCRNSLSPRCTYVAQSNAKRQECRHTLRVNVQGLTSHKLRHGSGKRKQVYGSSSRVLVRFDHIASLIVNANHSAM